jgi:hypothetical protein
VGVVIKQGWLKENKKKNRKEFDDVSLSPATQNPKKKSRKGELL